MLIPVCRFGNTYFPSTVWVNIALYGLCIVGSLMLGLFIAYVIKSGTSGNSYIDDVEFPRINPATGLPMSGGSDTGGNLYGSSTDDFSVYGSVGSSNTHNSLFND